MPARIPAPWLAFLRDVDHALSRPVEVHCLGGFVLAVLWGLPRPTADVDFIEIEPHERGQDLLRIAGEGSDLARQHKLRFDRVTVAEYPEGYASRLIEITPRGLKRLRLRAFEVHDLALAKLGRNSGRDRADVEFLIGKKAIDRHLLEARFDAELRPYVLNEDRHRAALQLWVQELFR
jgi:Nucleotidyltransferase of unknown function (DUF6036)